MAQVCVDAPGPHLDHPFSYLVPQSLATAVAPGVRVSVPFAGSDVPGWVLGVAPLEVPSYGERARPAGTAGAAGAADRPLRAVRRVVSPVPVLTPVVAEVARRVADHYAGTLADVLRTAVPPRHAGAETAFRAEVAGTPAAAVLDGAVAVPASASPAALLPVAVAERLPSPRAAADPGTWADLVGGEAFLRRMAAGQAPMAAACFPATTDPWQAMAVLADQAAPRTALLLVPDAADLDLAAAAISARSPGLRVVTMHHDLGPAARWRAFLRILTGLADVVVGTRSAAFVPLPRLGAVVVWDDGDDGHTEPRSPGWHVRVVAVERARREGAALVLAGHSRSVATQWLVRTGVCKSLEAPRAVRRESARVFAPSSDDPREAAARVPRTAHAVIADGLRRGPVLVSVPRRGYAPGLVCQQCREPAWCRLCAGGRLSVSAAGAAAACLWCGREDPAWTCATCGAQRLRAAAVGGRRIAEELGRAFPGSTVLSSDGAHRVGVVADTAGLVVATPGAEPVAPGGYAAAAILDADTTLARPGLAAGEDTVRRWLHVVSLVRPAAAGGTVVLVGDPGAQAVAAVVAAAPERYADRLCAERLESGLPPAGAAASMVGTHDAVADAAARVRGEPSALDGTLSLWSPDPPAVGPDPGPTGAGVPLPRRHGGTPVQVLGPVPISNGSGGPDGGHAERWRLLVLGERSQVVAAARDVLRHRSASHAEGSLTVRIDPVEL